MRDFLKLAFVLMTILALVAVGTIACDDDDDEDVTETPAVTQQPTTEPTAEPTAEPTVEPVEPAAGLTIEMSIGELLEDADGEAILRKCIGDEIIDNPQMAMAFGMTVPEVSTMTDKITDEMVACVEAGLAGGSAAPAAGLTIEMSIGELLEDADGEAVLRKCIGDEIIDNPQMAMAFGMTVPEVSTMTDKINDEMVACVEAGLAGGAAAPAAIDPDKSVYKVGAVLSISGPASSLGIPEDNTAKMIEDQINAAGGINGHELKVVIYDDETSAEKAATLTTRLIEQDKVMAIVGPTTSGNSMAIIDIVTNAKTPLVSCAASAAIVSPVEDRYWVFKTPQTDKEAVAEIYTYMKANGITKVAIITDTSGFGAGGRGFLLSDADGYGIEIVDDQTFDSGDPSMESQLTHIKGTDAQAVISWATTDESATVALDMKSLNMSIPHFASHGIANMDFIDQAGDAADDVIFPAGKLLFVDKVLDSDPQKSVLVDYVADYEALYGEGTISTFGGHMYDALMITIMALEKIDEGLDLSAARAAIRDAIEQTTAFAGTGGVFTMSADNHLGMAPGSLGMVKIVDGAWTLAP